jgi:NAD(P)-dependent dehydrogenase (short-subunit alcohol dehydrogenase family)
MPNGDGAGGRAAPGRTALVTGATRGIGLEVCRQLAGLGFAVVLGARDRARGEAAARAIAGEGADADGPGRVVARLLDVADPASVEAARDWVAAEFGRLDVLVNNAAVHYDDWQGVERPDWRVVREAFETNLLGAWRAAAAFAPLLRRSAHGRLVNVSSESGSLAGMGRGGAPAYSISKAALNALTRQLAADLRDAGVLVNSVCPGWVATDMGGPGGRPVAEGAASVVWAATLPDGGPTGGFFRDGRPLAW